MMKLFVIYTVVSLILLHSCQCFVSRYPARHLALTTRIQNYDGSDLDLVVQQSLHQNFWKETFEYATQSFTIGFESKFIGFVFGNILAGVAVKLVTDAIRSAAENFAKEKQELSTTSPPNTSRSNDRIQEISGTQWAMLVVCVFLDLVGDSSFALPGVGELEDVVWAPLSAFALSKIFGSSTVTTIDFLKEILPGADILPVASIAWILQNLYPDSTPTKILGISPKSPAPKSTYSDDKPFPPKPSDAEARSP